MPVQSIMNVKGKIILESRGLIILIKLVLAEFIYAAATSAQ